MALVITNPWTLKAGQYKGQLHCHTTGSDGVDTPTNLVTAYKNAGYDFISVTDHNAATADPSVSGILFIPGVEETATEGHICCINRTSQDASSVAQTIINNAVSAGAIAQINHPNWSGSPWTDAEILATAGAVLMEIYNSASETGDGGTGDADDKYDNCISNLYKQIWLTATDDCHDIAGDDFNKAWVVVNAASLSIANIIAELTAGNFYASTGAVISDITKTGNTITITTPASASIKWIKRSGVEIKTTTGATSDSYTITGNEFYVRALITRDLDGARAWTQPIFITDDGGAGVDDSYTKILLHMDGANGSLNIIDEGGKTPTIEGATCLKTAVAKFGVSSCYFDGTSDKISYGADSDLYIGTQAFTFDCWFRCTTLSRTNIILSYEGTDTGFGLMVGGANKIGVWNTAGGDYAIQDTATIAKNTWYHVAVVGNGGPDGARTIKAYKNGALLGTWTTNYNFTSEIVRIGGNAITNSIAGYIDEARLSIGVERWTGAFTPLEYPYQTLVGRDDAYSVLLLHCDGGDNSTLFPDEVGCNVLPYGNVSVDTAQSKFGGASAYYDGSGDYLKIDDLGRWDFGSDSFTIDFWVYPTALANYNNTVGQYLNDSNRWYTQFSSTGWVNFVAYSGGTCIADYVTQAGVITINTWHHVAIVRNGTGTSCVKLFVDGVDYTPVSPAVNLNAATMPNVAGSLYIGQKGSGANYYAGYMDEIRISKGIARWTADFTPPTAAYAPPAPPASTGILFATFI